jgi:hypothetical protein
MTRRTVRRKQLEGDLLLLEVVLVAQITVRRAAVTTLSAMGRPPRVPRTIDARRVK